MSLTDAHACETIAAIPTANTSIARRSPRALGPRPRQPQLCFPSLQVTAPLLELTEAASPGGPLCLRSRRGMALRFICAPCVRCSVLPRFLRGRVGWTSSLHSRRSENVFMVHREWAPWGWSSEPAGLLLFL